VARCTAVLVVATHVHVHKRCMMHKSPACAATLADMRQMFGLRSAWAAHLRHLSALLQQLGHELGRPHGALELAGVLPNARLEAGVCQCLPTNTKISQ